jgi:3-hydroxybutyryl-CoA dehydrogenase
VKIEKIGVIGAGQMGNGIAHVCALAGYDVVMEDINPEALRKARATIERNLTARRPEATLRKMPTRRSSAFARPSISTACAIAISS